jgi:hypothetical protein
MQLSQSPGLLIRISELEYENARLKKHGSAGNDINAIIRGVYNVCILRKAEIEYYNAKNAVEENLNQKRYASIAKEYVSLSIAQISSAQSPRTIKYKDIRYCALLGILWAIDNRHNA